MLFAIGSSFHILGFLWILYTIRHIRPLARPRDAARPEAVPRERRRKTHHDHKQQMLGVLRGQPGDRIPWVPRLDLWYRAHRRAGTLPPHYADATLMEMVDDLGFGYHAVIPDFKALRTPDDEAHRALGIYNLSCMPVRTVLDGID